LFSIDEKFDGLRRTQPNGVIYIVTGGGGGALVDRKLTWRTELWKRTPANWQPFTASLIADRHSFTQVTLSSQLLTMRQLDESGAEIDRIQVSKPPPSKAR